MSSLKYNILEPKIPVSRPPLFLMLHGYGSNEDDLYSFANELNDRFLVISLRAPRTLQWGGYAWYDINFMSNDGSRFGDSSQAMHAVNMVAEFIVEATKKYNTDPDKTVLMGLSQGAITSYAVSLHYPNLVDKVLAMSGYVFADIMPEKINQTASKHLEYFVSHGTMDEVIPVAWARQADAWLTAHGLVYQYREYPMGHGINPACFQDMIQWIQERYPVLAAK